jgi:hypothetical protein
LTGELSGDNFSGAKVVDHRVASLQHSPVPLMTAATTLLMVVMAALLFAAARSTGGSLRRRCGWNLNGDHGQHRSCETDLL